MIKELKGYNINNKILHIVCGMSEDTIHMITAYYPDTDKWEGDMKQLEEKIMNCFMCKGDLEAKKVNYVVDLENTIIIKGVPAKVCTGCGEQYFDDETAENIEKIVNQLNQLATEVTIVNYKEKVA